MRILQAPKGIQIICYESKLNEEVKKKLHMERIRQNSFLYTFAKTHDDKRKVS